MDLLSVIRRWHHRDQLPIREITRRTGLSRNTIRKYLANGEVSPAYPARKSVSKLDPFAETLLSWLKREPKRNRKRRRNLKQLHRDLVALGFDGSYDRVAARFRAMVSHFLFESEFCNPAAGIARWNKELFTAQAATMTQLTGVLMTADLAEIKPGNDGESFLNTTNRDEQFSEETTQ